MKQIFLPFKLAVLSFSLLFLVQGGAVYAQCNRPYIKIDGNRVLADNSQTQNGLILPLWLKAGQTLAADQNVISISVIEFAAVGSTLTFSQVLSVTSMQTVPANTVWKVESIIKSLIYNTNSSLVVSTGGSYNWTVPPCVTYVCIELWGAGGGGGGGNSNPAGGGGGGAGAYASQCFPVIPGTVYTITLGSGGAGGNGGVPGSAGGASSVGALISAGGGSGGLNGNVGGTGGTGGTSSATYNLAGGNGQTRGNGTLSGTGGGSPNGGIGGAGSTGTGNPGISPGGGGAGGGAASGAAAAGSGADGKVILNW